MTIRIVTDANGRKHITYEPLLHPPQQEPEACKECHLKDLVYDLLGELKVANLKLSVRAQRTWVGLTDAEIMQCLDQGYGINMRLDGFARIIEAKLKEKNT